MIFGAAALHWKTMRGDGTVIDQGRVTTAVEPVGHRDNGLQFIDAVVHGSRPNQREGRWNVWDKSDKGRRTP